MVGTASPEGFALVDYQTLSRGRRRCLLCTSLRADVSSFFDRDGDIHPGHTDLVGSQIYSRSLGLRRAQAAVAFLTSQGINRSRLDAVASFGETKPLVATESRERQNRRTVTEVSGFVQNDPTVLNGKYAQIIFREYVASATARQTVTAAAAE